MTSRPVGDATPGTRFIQKPDLYCTKKYTEHDEAELPRCPLGPPAINDQDDDTRIANNVHPLLRQNGDKQSFRSQ